MSDGRNEPHVGAVPAITDESWSLTDRYPVVGQLLGYVHPKIDDIFDASIVIIDANILIAAWETADDTHPVVNLVSKLHELGKLVVPAQIAREYYHKKSSKVITVRKSLVEATRQNSTSFDFVRLKSILHEDERLSRLEEVVKDLISLKKELKKAADAVQIALGQASAGFGHLSENLDRKLSDCLYDPNWSDDDKITYSRKP